MKIRTWNSAWACAALLCSQMAAAQDAAATYPSKPVTVIVVVTPGGVAETEVRIYTPRLQESLGKPFIFDYKPGAGGSVGFATGAKAAPDGHTIVATSPAFTTAPVVMAVNYDPIRDYAPVVQLGRQFGIVVVHPSVPVEVVPTVLNTSITGFEGELLAGSWEAAGPAMLPASIAAASSVAFLLNEFSMFSTWLVSLFVR